MIDLVIEIGIVLLAFLVIYAFVFKRLGGLWSLGLYISVAIIIAGVFIPTVVEVEMEGEVTDKWTRLIFGSTRFYFEIDNITTTQVTHFDYNNVDIGDTYSYTYIHWE